MIDFFISYNKADKAMAIAIRAWLEEAGYSTISQAADFQAGSNFVIEMDRAIKDSRKTLALLSADYLDAPFPQSEWAAAFAKDPTGEDRTLITVRVRDCRPTGLLGQVVYIDLVDLSMSDMESTLIQALSAKPVASKSPPTRKKRTPTKAAQPPPSASVSMNATGNRIFQAGRDMVLTKKHVTKNAIVPQEHHITDGQAKVILDLLKELGERDGAAGKGNTYGLWQAKFKERPWAGPDADGITSYKLLPAEEYDLAVKWISQQKAIGRPALRRTQNDEWRKDQHRKIWGSAKKLGWDEETVHAFAQQHLKIKTPVSTLKDIGERNLAKLAGAIYRRSKKPKASV